MNYLNQLKEKENQLINLEAQVMAKKQAIEEILEKKKKAEAEVQSQLGISLADVPAELEASREKLATLLEELNDEIEELEVEFSKIKC